MSKRVLLRLTLVCALLTGTWLLFVSRTVTHAKMPFAAVIDKAEAWRLERAGEQIEFRRAGERWTVAASSPSAAASVYPIEDESRKRLESSLRDMQLEDVISERADRAANFDLDAQHAVHLTLLSPSGATLSDGWFGKDAPDGSHVYFRYADSPVVYLARGVPRGDLGSIDPNAWRSRSLVSLSENQINSVRIQTREFSTELAKSSDTWTLGGAPANSAPVYTLIGALAHLRADDFVPGPEADALQKKLPHYAWIVVKSSTTSETLDLLSPPDPKTQRYPVMSSAAAGVAWVDRHRVDALLIKPQDLALKK